MIKTEGATKDMVAPNNKAILCPRKKKQGKPYPGDNTQSESTEYKKEFIINGKN